MLGSVGEPGWIHAEEVADPFVQEAKQTFTAEAAPAGASSTRTSSADPFHGAATAVASSPVS
jgi:hypothetical protein